MDDQRRDDLLAKLSDARKREAQALLQLQAHAATIDQVRQDLGNPYFYSGRADDDLESKAKFTGYKSHEPGLQLYRDWQDAAREVVTIRKELQEGGLDTE
jgi:hypothetical protein